MVYLKSPLKTLRLSQPFGVDYVGEGFYERMGMKGHNGLDFSAPNGTECYAVMDGEAFIDIEAPVGLPLPGYTSGYGINIRIRNRELGLEVVYGHLQNTLVKNGQTVKAGDAIGRCDNTGTSTGSHLHFGVRRIHWDKSGAGPYVDDYGNGYFGYVDPMPLMDPDAFKLPVDFGYGSRRMMTDWQWYASSWYFFNEIKKVEGSRRLMTEREKKAFVYGAWDFRAVVNPAMFAVWSQMTKMAAKSKGIIK